jgi:hypothetical protein
MLVVLLCLTYVACEDKQRVCGDRLRTLVNKVCSFGKETNPCFKNGQNIDSIDTNVCCSQGCSMQDMQKFCCFTDRCLDQCYPGKGYKLGQVY